MTAEGEGSLDDVAASGVQEEAGVQGGGAAADDDEEAAVDGAPSALAKEPDAPLAAIDAAGDVHGLADERVPLAQAPSADPPASAALGAESA